MNIGIYFTITIWGLLSPKLCRNSGLIVTWRYKIESQGWPILDLAEARGANQKTFQLRQIVISIGRSTLSVRKQQKAVKTYDEDNIKVNIFIENIILLIVKVISSRNSFLLQEIIS